MEKTKGDTGKAIELLRKYIDIFMTDTEAWAELADLYVQVDSLIFQSLLLGCEFLLFRVSNCIFGVFECIASL